MNHWKGVPSLNQGVRPPWRCVAVTVTPAGVPRAGVPFDLLVTIPVHSGAAFVDVSPEQWEATMSVNATASPDLPIDDLTSLVSLT